MNNKNIPTGIGTIVLVIIAVSVGMFVWQYEKNLSIELEPQTPPQLKEASNSKPSNKIEISNKWTLVSHSNFWNNPNLFTNANYKFPDIDFSYPDNWEFECCGDMDHSSEHIIYSSKDHNKSLPYIRITDYALTGCPNSQNKCSLDETVTVTASEEFNRLTSTISVSDVLEKIKLDKLNTMAFVYKKSEGNNKFSKGYIINLKDSVLGLDFVNYELLDSTFIENFLNHISFEAR